METANSEPETEPTADVPKAPDGHLPRNLSIIRLAMAAVVVVSAVTWAIIRFVVAGGAIEEAGHAQVAAQNAALSASRDASATDDRLRAARASLSAATDPVFLSPASEIDALKDAVTFAQGEYQSSAAKMSKAEQALADASARLDGANAFASRVTNSAYIGLGVLLALCLLYLPVKRHLRLEAERRAEIAAALKAIEDEQEKVPSTEFENLWVSNKQQLRHYHRLVLKYAESTRQLTRLTLVGAAVLMLGVGAFSLFVDSTSSAISSAVLTAVSAGVTGYVARAVLRNSESSSKELGAFFAHPLEVERALAAERIVLTMPEEEQSAAKLIIVKFLAAKRAAVSAQPSDAKIDDSTAKPE
ncbi:hypothetical protein [Kutzneria chonburiensis]|uniref:Uncharacterized protein n=1 Tax=Kutzneria chonburiensis TaxID=1483604 RepID=A0ABV6N277_9PSEU|nr:hypothetical protein [Kutzneria chonburiensis]